MCNLLPCFAIDGTGHTGRIVIYADFSGSIQFGLNEIRALEGCLLRPVRPGAAIVLVPYAPPVLLRRAHHSYRQFEAGEVTSPNSGVIKRIAVVSGHGSHLPPRGGVSAQQADMREDRCTEGGCQSHDAGIIRWRSVLWLVG